MSDVKRFEAEIHQDKNYVDITLDAEFFVQVRGNACDDSGAIVDLALKSLRAKMIEALEEMKA